MSEEAAIQRTINLYSEGVSRRDWTQVFAVFADDAVWAMPAGNILMEGKDAIRRGIPELVAPTAFLVQLNSPAVIDVDGDRAKARSVIREAGQFIDRRESFDAFGTYFDDLRKIDGEWLFVRREFAALGVTMAAVLERDMTLPEKQPA